MTLTNGPKMFKQNIRVSVGLFLKRVNVKTKETINISTIAVIHYFS